MSDELKTKGNAAFSAGNYQEAIDFFTQAIAQDPENHVLYSNRSASHCSLKHYDEALNDAEKTITIKPDWAKGYSRKGAALHGAEKYDDAIVAYKAGLQIDPNNALLTKGLKEVEEAMAQPTANPFAKMFGPDMWGKIASKPNLAPFLQMPDVVAILNQIQQNPSSINAHMGDQRIMQIIMGLIGLEGNFAGAGNDTTMEDSDMPPLEEVEELKAPSKSKSTPAPAPKKQEPEVVMEEVPKELTARELSDAQKDLGNAAYKSRKFDEAVEFYDKAWELDNTNLSVVTNKSAVLFEKQSYKECIEVCEKVIELGLEIHADFKILARAFGRMGNAYAKLNDLENAIKYLQKSLAEHRTPEVLTRLRELEKIKKESDKENYRNPQLSDEARERGNDFFKQGKFVDGVREYTEAINRNDKDPRNYSNRAACYAKLLAMNEAEKDCNTAIALDPTFVKAYIRKAAILYTKRDYMSCIDLCNEAKGIDTENKHTAELEAQIMKCYSGLNQVQSSGDKAQVQKEAMANPEVQAVLSDPVMQQILQQMQSDPAAAQEHMKNPMIAKKIRTLVNAGIVRMG